MTSAPEPLASINPEANIKSILEWLALAHGRTGAEDADQLHRQLLLLREAPIPNIQRLKLLDLLYVQAERIASAELPRLKKISLPISRKLRQRVRILLDLLEIMAQDYFNTLADLFDPLGSSTLHFPHTSLRRAMGAIAWQVRITHLIASPCAHGLWQQLHAAFNTARRLGLEDFPGPNGGPSIRHTYSAILLSAIAQPAAFAARELEFISEYIASSTQPLEFFDTPPLNRQGIFWIDPDKDFPAQALIRRIPSPDTQVLYFCCDLIADNTLKHSKALQQGSPAASLGLPAFADTHTGPGILLRLNKLWGHPVKRRFSRRRQSYRATICSGLNNLWQLIRTPEKFNGFSEWMVTNESPDGYALMHVSGHTENIRVGDIVAMQPIGEHSEFTPVWHICLIRWAISENPEHVELGLQIFAPKAIPVEVAHPYELSNKVSALLLPSTPPLRPTQSLIVPTGLFKENTRRIIVILEEDNLEIREVQATRLDEQTNSIEIFSVSPDETH